MREKDKYPFQGGELAVPAGTTPYGLHPFVFYEPEGESDSHYEAARQQNEAVVVEGCRYRLNFDETPPASDAGKV